jgi:hypothetical protein
VKTPLRERLTLAWVLLFIPVFALFYWKILLTNQFSLLTSSEGVNQGYSWLRFWISSVRHGTLPIWDPYGLAGHSFAGEMQTGAFNPLRLVLALVPFNHDGVLSPKLYHVWYAAMHLMAACFMFALVRELGLSRFPAFVAGLCFSMGGFVARMGWPDMFESAAWLPVVFLFLLRALRSETVRRTAWNAALSGLGIGMTILASRIHIVIMEMLAVGSAAIFYACVSKPEAPDGAGRAVRPAWFRAGLAVAVAGAIGALAGAVQLLPSVEYSHTAYRLLGTPGGSLPANIKIPYADMPDQLYPHAISYLAFAFGYGGNASQGEAPNPYIGFFPLLAAIVGIRRYWGNPWVRYLSGLAVAAFLYCLGSFSPLNGLLYAVVPRLWMVRESTRMAYLLDFALVILAAFGLEALISAGAGKASWPGLDRVLQWGVVACAVALFVPAVWTKPEIGVNPWNSLSILIIFASYGLFRFMENGNRGPGPRAILVGLILFDLAAFDWAPRNKIEVAQQGGDQLERILTARGAAAFLRSQPGPFRIRVQADPTPNVGDLFGVPMVDPAHPGSITIPYVRILGDTDLLNVRYFLTSSGEQRPGAVYQDAWWKVYENPTGYPRAWVVHTAWLEPSDKAAAEGLGAAGFDARRAALVEKPVTLDAAVDGAAEPVTYPAVEANRMAMEVRAASRGMLVMSENYYPGWRATVNGRPAEIYRVDGALRGVVLPAGFSRVTLDYAPASVYWGGALSLATFLGVAAIWFFGRRKSTGR